MDINQLTKTANAMVADHRGILAMDESNSTCNMRFASLGLPQTEELRRAYREVLITTPGLERFINGAILSDETIRQSNKDNIKFTELLKSKGILIGIKVDKGTAELAGFAGEKITAGLDGLAERLSEYYQLGARFAKWRAVITIGERIPSWNCIESNAHNLARYAALCQQVNILPIVEPEVLMDGKHPLERCKEVTENTLHALFNQLYKQHVNLKGIILKPNMILPGKDCSVQVSSETVAEQTIDTLLKCVPASVPGIAFLSGGQSGELASQRLNDMNKLLESPFPWSLTFSFARALQFPAMEIWNGKEENTFVAQQALIHRALCNKNANKGIYSPEIEERL